jgi:hypothetical protein
VFYGHPNVQSLHARTIEITRDERLTPRGDCIIGIRSNKACADLSERIKRRLTSDESIVNIEIAVGSQSFAITGIGDHRLTLSSRHDIVVRKTNFVCPRTMSIRCDKASNDIPRKIVRLLQDSDARGLLRVSTQ